MTEVSRLCDMSSGEQMEGKVDERTHGSGVVVAFSVGLWLTNK
jgi:hypothetical protein